MLKGLKIVGGTLALLFSMYLYADNAPSVKSGYQSTIETGGVVEQQYLENGEYQTARYTALAEAPIEKYTVSTLSTELTEARDTYQLGKLERQLAKADLLILDELSYLSFNRYESDLLFKVISDRSEQSSTIVTTNLPFARWTELFENTTMVSALVDRCGSYVVKIQRSCRFFVSKRIISRISLNSPLKALDNILK